MDCLSPAWSAMLYAYRAAIPAADLPADVAARPNCWYGQECRTQLHNLGHAQRLNHVCARTR